MTTESSQVDAKSNSGIQSENVGLVNFSEQVQKNLPDPGIGIIVTGSSSMKITLSVGESGDQEKNSDVTPLNRANSVQQSDQVQNPVGDEVIFPGTFGASESSMLPEVPGSSSGNNNESHISHVDGFHKSPKSSFADECCGKQSLIEKVSDTKDAAELEKTSSEDRVADTSAGEHVPALNTDGDQKLTSSFVKVDDLADCHEDKTAAIDSSKEHITSVSKESFEVAAEPAIVIETGKVELPDPAAAGGTLTVVQSVSSKSTSSAYCDEVSHELNQKMEHSVSELMVDAAATVKKMETEIGRSKEPSSSAVSVTGCCVKTVESNQLFASGVSCVDLSEREKNKIENLERDSIEGIGQVPSRSTESGVNAVPEEGNFTFDTRPEGGQFTGDSGKCVLPFPSIPASKLSSKTTAVSPSTFGKCQADPVVVKETSQGGSLLRDGDPPSGGAKCPSERRTKHVSSRSGKQRAERGKQVKEIITLRQTEKGNKSLELLSPSGAAQVTTFESTVKPKEAVSTPTSNLSDLRTSAPPSAFFKQPFTDLQQVQLRAQIFVYGSFIQGVAPDEACMVSAFGMSDGGRSFWEPSWRAYVERFRGHRSQGNNTETPLRPPSGAKAVEKASSLGSPQSEVLSSAVGPTSIKVVPSTLPNSLTSLSSPLWNITNPSSETLPFSSMERSVSDYRAVSPLHPYHTRPVRNVLAHTTSWPSQAPLAVPWLASSQSPPFGINANYSAYQITEPEKLTTVKESSAATGKKPGSPVHGTHSGTMIMSTYTPSLVDLGNVTVSTSQISADAKIRKRKKSSTAADLVKIPETASVQDTVASPLVANSLLKKAPAVEGLSENSLLAQNQVGLKSTPNVSTSHYSTSVAVTISSCFVPNGTSNQFLAAALPSTSNDHLKRDDISVDKCSPNLDGLSKVEEARSQAEEAATRAATAISHCQEVWNNLNQQRNAGLMSDAEAKLASASVAIAAAASIANAAAAAAKIASTTAVQAKQMADEALAKYGTPSDSEHDITYSMNHLADATPMTILKGGDQNKTSSFAISAAREAARKKVEAASTATRHAENLEAIVRAAELAAEAVSQTGKIVCMGEPKPLSELVEAGLEGCLKLSQVTSEPGSKPNDTNKNKSDCSNVREGLDALTNHVQPDNNGPTHVVLPSQESGSTLDDDVTVGNLTASNKHCDKDLEAEKDKRVSAPAKTPGAPDPDIESGPNSLIPCAYGNTENIKEGSLVEVVRDHGDLEKAWFSANVLDLKDGEALVCYTEIRPSEGSEQLKEWVSLEAEDGSAPVVRIPHPSTASQPGGMRKRRRAAVKDYVWSVGDKVDAWVKDCWREGIITEKNINDATKLKVHFPAQGETLSIRAWHLRPTVIWRDGQWKEWCRVGHDSTFQGDTPMQKRSKLGTTGIETKEKNTMAKTSDSTDIGTNELPRLPLWGNEKGFNIGTTRDENNHNTVRKRRTGLQKGGVVFGIPKPGKKTKFMEVSKHYISDATIKNNVPSDSVKLAEFLTPRGSASQGWKNNSRIDVKEKQAVGPKPKAPKSGKPPSMPSRKLARKDDTISSKSDASTSEQNISEFGSFTNIEETNGSTVVFSSQTLPPETRKILSRNIRSEQLNKGKLVLPSGKSGKSEENEQMISEIAEPRRSNRRIQPTSRLLEGLQSAVINPKIPPPSHSHSKDTTTRE